MAVKETKDILKGFTDTENNFKNELKSIGRNCLILLQNEVIYTHMVLKDIVNSIVTDIFRIYISTENLKDFLSVNPNNNFNSDKAYLNNFLELETVTSIVIALFESFKGISLTLNDKSIAKSFEELYGSKYALESFLEYFKEIHEHLTGVVANE